MSNAKHEQRKSRSRGLQFSIVTLLVAMTWIAMLCTALQRPSAIWAVAMLGTTLLTLLVAGLVIIYRRGATQAFAVGFVSFGGAYLLCLLMFGGLSTAGMSEVSMALYWRWHAPRDGGVPYRNPTYPVSTPVTSYAPVVEFPVYQPATSGGATSPGPQPLNQVYAVVQSVPYQPGHFNDVFHSGFALILGVLGGVVAQVLHRTRRESDGTS